MASTHFSTLPSTSNPFSQTLKEADCDVDISGYSNESALVSFYSSQESTSPPCFSRAATLVTKVSPTLWSSSAKQHVSALPTFNRLRTTPWLEFPSAATHSNSFPAAGLESPFVFQYVDQMSSLVPANNLILSDASLNMPPMSGARYTFGSSHQPPPPPTTHFQNDSVWRNAPKNDLVLPTSGPCWDAAHTDPLKTSYRKQELVKINQNFTLQQAVPCICCSVLCICCCCRKEFILTGDLTGCLCLSCDSVDHPMPKCPNGAFVCPNCHRGDHRGNECEQNCRYCGKKHVGVSIMNCLKDAARAEKAQLDNIFESTDKLLQDPDSQKMSGSNKSSLSLPFNASDQATANSEDSSIFRSSAVATARGGGGLYKGLPDTLSTQPTSFSLTSHAATRPDNSFGRTVWISRIPLECSDVDAVAALNAHLTTGGVVRLSRKTGYEWAYVEMDSLEATFEIVSRRVRIMGRVLKVQFRKSPGNILSQGMSLHPAFRPIPATEQQAFLDCNSAMPTTCGVVTPTIPADDRNILSSLNGKEELSERTVDAHADAEAVIDGNMGSLPSIELSLSQTSALLSAKSLPAATVEGGEPVLNLNVEEQSKECSINSRSSSISSNGRIAALTLREPSNEYSGVEDVLTLSTSLSYFGTSCNKGIGGTDLSIDDVTLPSISEVNNSLKSKLSSSVGVDFLAEAETIGVHDSLDYLLDKLAIDNESDEQSSRTPSVSEYGELKDADITCRLLMAQQHASIWRGAATRSTNDKQKLMQTVTHLQDKMLRMMGDNSLVKGMELNELTLLEHELEQTYFTALTNSKP